jgi:NAD(P)-dependent dehydrogenase (short-subunit alcohol dehydrogenase family)
LEKGTSRVNRNSVVIVTGANAGMGKATSIALARTGATIVMLSRSRERGEKAVNEVRSLTGNNSVELMLCDLGSLESIENFCREFKSRHSRLNVLVNNAGAIHRNRHETVDGYEATFGVNHLGHFLLTNRLLDLLIASAPSRIINLSSSEHRKGIIDFEDINLTKNYSLKRAYRQSKLANVLFTYELAERLKSTGVTANCVHPGVIHTGMTIKFCVDGGYGKFVARILRPFFRSPDRGAETAIYLAISPKAEGVTGKYFYRKKPVSSSKRSYIKADAKKLWDLSEKMTGF